MQVHLRFNRGITDSKRVRRATIEFVRVLPEVIDITGRVSIEFLPIPAFLYEVSRDEPLILEDVSRLNAAVGLYLPYETARPLQRYILVCASRDPGRPRIKNWPRYILSTIAHEFVHYGQGMAGKELHERGVESRTEWIMREVCARSPLLTKLLADADENEAK